MKTPWLRWLLGVALAVGCGRGTDPVGSDAPPPPKPTRREAPAALRDDPPSPDNPRLPQPTQAALPPNLLQQYQQHWNNPEERARLIDLVAIHALESDDKQSAVRTFGDMLRVETTPDLKVALLDELATLETAAALEPILRHLQAGEPEDVREAATAAAEATLTSFAFAETKPSLEQLSPLLDARYPASVREAAIAALQDLDDKRAIPHLQRLLQDPDETVRAAAEAGIEWLQQQE